MGTTESTFSPSSSMRCHIRKTDRKIKRDSKKLAVENV